MGNGGDDIVVGNAGQDVAFLGDGNDSFQWNPGDGSDVVEGQDGQDTMLFSGSAGDDNIDVSANGSRERLTGDAGSTVMDFNGVELLDVNTSGGGDRVDLGDMSGTALAAANVNLADGPAGDGRADSVTVNGTDAGDAARIIGSRSAGITVIGLSTVTHIALTDGPTDGLTLNMLGGDDAVDASGLAAAAVSLTVDGGDGDDVLQGSAGNDFLIGGPGDDVLIGGPGQDVLDGGDGSNILLE